jgi:hypothetical protein
MSFDLFFCCKEGQKIDFESIAAWAQSVGSFTREGNQLWYQNESTGVYFNLDFENDPEDARVPSGAFDTGLSFNLNFGRPSFFAFEAMPVVEELARRFDLSVFDPQARDAEPVQQTAVASKLTESWLASNRWAVGALIEQSVSSVQHHMLPSKSLYLWNYMKARRQLEDVCGEDVFVPRLVPVRRKNDTAVDTAVVCSEGVPMILPASDWVIIVRQKKGLFRPKKDSEVGVISRKTFDGLLGSHAHTFDWNDPPVQVIQPASAGPVAKILTSLERMLAKDEFEILALDSFVDVERPVANTSP